MLSLLLAVSLAASAIDPGDVYLSTETQFVFGTRITSGIFLSADGKLKTGPSAGGALSAQFDARGHLFLLFNLGLREYDPSFALVRDTMLPEQSFNMVTDGVGGAYVVGASGMTYYYGPNGSLQRQFQLPGLAYPTSTVHIEPAEDQCTLAYVNSEGVMAGGVTVQRFDACTMEALSPRGQGERFTTIRLMRDGGFVGAQQNTLKFYDAAGNLVLTRAVAPGPDLQKIGSIAFDSDSAYIWTASTGGFVSKVRIADSKTVASQVVGPVLTLAVNGERRPAAATLLGGRRRATGH